MDLVISHMCFLALGMDNQSTREGVLQLTLTVIHMPQRVKGKVSCYSILSAQEWGQKWRDTKALEAQTGNKVPMVRPDSVPVRIHRWQSRLVERQQRFRVNIPVNGLLHNKRREKSSKVSPEEEQEVHCYKYHKNGKSQWKTWGCTYFYQKRTGTTP